VDICIEICRYFGLPITHNNGIDQHLVTFQENNRYHKIDLNISAILNSIKQQTNYDLTQTNSLQQAWIDNYLVDQYNIDPLLKNEYFENTLDLVKAYNL
jgi:hypothetical protein